MGEYAQLCDEKLCRCGRSLREALHVCHVVVARHSEASYIKLQLFLIRQAQRRSLCAITRGYYREEYETRKEDANCLHTQGCAGWTGGVAAGLGRRAANRAGMT